MSKRPIIGLTIALIFVGLIVSGIWLLVTKGQTLIIVLHVILGLAFIGMALVHAFSNRRSLLAYTKTKSAVLLGFLALFGVVWSIRYPASYSNLETIYGHFKSRQTVSVNKDFKHIVLHEDPNFSLEIRAGKHYWFPQMAIWLTDSNDQYISTLFVTEATATGTFFGGRTKTNFRSFDEHKQRKGSLRRVDALPYWSHMRGLQANDGLFAPTPMNPVPDAITGATPSTSSLFEGQIPKDRPFNLLLELNVAFDENEYYSEFDFPNDTLYHNGSGLMGQPSVVYEAKIIPGSRNRYHLMTYKGHTSPTGNTGQIFAGSDRLTTAMEILDVALFQLK